MSKTPPRQTPGLRLRGNNRYPTKIIASQYMVRLYWQTFQRGCQFWSSIDGNSGELVIAEQPDWWNILVQEFGARFPMLNVMRIDRMHVCREHADSEFFDDPCPGARRSGVVWRTCDYETPFPVRVVDPYSDQNRAIIKACQAPA